MMLNLAYILQSDGTVTQNSRQIKTLVRTVLHELTHAMVFHPNLFQDYLDERGNKISWNGGVTWG